MRRASFLSLLVLAAAVPAFAADSWNIDPVHSNVIFKIQHLGTSRFIGRFNSVAGKIVWDQDPAKSSIEVTVKTDSIDTNNADRDKHLKSPDFFNAKQHPTITFKSTKVEKGEKDYTLTGDLTLHGETHPVTARFEIT